MTTKQSKTEIHETPHHTHKLLEKKKRYFKFKIMNIQIFNKSLRNCIFKIVFNRLTFNRRSSNIFICRYVICMIIYIENVIQGSS